MTKQQKRERATAFLEDFAGRDDWIVVDTETTGPDAHTDEIVEVSILSATGDVLVDRLVKPETEIKEGAQDVHGITPEDVTDAPPISECTEVLWLFRHHPTLIYNRDFDGPIIRHSFDVHGVNLDTGAWDLRCVMKAYAMACGEWSDYHGSFSWCKLEDAVQERGISQDGIELHRAKGDAELTRRLVRSFA